MKIIVLYKEYIALEEWRVSQETYLVIGSIARLIKTWDGNFMGEDESSWKDESFPKAQHELCWKVKVLAWIFKAPCKLYKNSFKTYNETGNTTPFEWYQDNFSH